LSHSGRCIIAALGDLRVEQLQSDACREAGQHALRDEPGEATRSRERHHQLHHTDHHGRGSDAGNPEADRDGQHEDLERRCRASDLKHRATERGGEDSADRSGHEACARRQPRGNRQGQVEGERDGADGQRRQRVGDDRLPGEDFFPTGDPRPAHALPLIRQHGERG
jgi:hypothetical protein